jgi:hypothetical protein
MICVMPIIIGVSIMASFDRFVFGLAIGMYLITFMEHFHAIRFVVRKREKRQ